jgi:hypothetical protein
VFAILQKATISFIMSACLSVYSSTQNSLDFHGIRYLSVFKKFVKKVQVCLKSGKNNVYFTLKPKYTYNILLILFRMRNVSGNSCREKNAHFVFSIFFFNCAVFEIMWKNIVELDRLQMTVWCMHFACQLTKARLCTHS